VRLSYDAVREEFAMGEQKQPGRPRLDQEAPMDGYNVRLTSWHARAARTLGNGNMAEGIRRAIEALYHTQVKPA